MNFTLFIFLSAFFFSMISDVTPNQEEFAMKSLIDEENQKKEIKDNPAKDKDNNFKDVKEYVFTTKNTNGTESEISVKATTDLNIALKNYKLINQTTTPPTGKPSEDSSEKKTRRTPGPNEPAFWTGLAKALNSTWENADARDQLFQPIPNSDLNATTEDKVAGVWDDAKLKSMLGISLATLFLFVILMAVSSALLYKLKTNYTKNYETQYAINPELASLSYFHTAEGVSDTSFTKSADSNTFLGGTSSEQKRTDIRSKSRMMDMISTASDDDMSEEFPTDE